MKITDTINLLMENKTIKGNELVDIAKGKYSLNTFKNLKRKLRNLL